MTPPATPNPYKRHRFPGEISSHAVWLYYRFSVSHRDVEELLFERSMVVSYETIRKWCRKFGQDYANKLRRPPVTRNASCRSTVPLITQHFRPRRHLLRAGEYRQEMVHRFEIWQDITGTATA
jgi:hypothetical protein